ncbi:hypothetical protein SASPL_108104 [Salvia splendens]|uniref:Uncharacterized protein n=1 Tax=Salvia splendens TaxID=180675 RepID=A0A8X8YDN4_SALSN|nr:hypothetical protein SASPL_108104 [Salvia splendens]
MSSSSKLLQLPAVVCFGKKQRFLGTAGAASSTMNSKYTISQIKRFIGRKFSDAELQKDIKSLPFLVTEGPDGYPLIHAQYLGENRTFTPTQLLGMVLSDLKIIAEKNLNAAVVDCCIEIPVYFTDLQRRAVIDAATIAGQLKILAHSYDQCLGGRDFDEVLFQHFAAKFKDGYKIDVHLNARACLRLRVACEKLKKVLSENAEESLNIECLMDEKDVIGFMKRDDFEQISSPILERVRKPLEKALACAQLTTQDIHSVEVVGLGSRVPMITKILTKFFGKEPRRTINASQCVSEGSALQCAILSPAFKVKDFQVIESFPFSIVLSWKMAAPDDTQTGAADMRQSTVVPPPPIDPFQSTNGKRAKLKLKVRLNVHGIASIECATDFTLEILFGIPGGKTICIIRLLEVIIRKEQRMAAGTRNKEAEPASRSEPISA